MAAAVRPSPADARVPCPLCGGLIHPIAGRCKHCKGDLRAMRSARPAAAATLPALASGAAAAPTYTRGNQNGHPAQAGGQLRNGHAAYAPPVATPPPQAAAPVPMAAPALDGSRPVLPPRPTGRMYAAPPAPAWWKSWPLIVIALAGLAIVAAVILMVWPPPREDEPIAEPVKAGKLAPAPERMDTDPLPPTQPGPTPAPNPPPPAAPDPWNGGNGALPAPAAPDADPDVDIPDDPDAPDPDDSAAADPDVSGGVVGGVGGIGGGGASGPTLQGASAIMIGMMRHACDRATTCGQLDDMMQDYCKMTRSLPLAPPPATCTAAQRCFEEIDQMSCTVNWSDVSALNSVMYKFQACIEAMAC